MIIIVLILNAFWYRIVYAIVMHNTVARMWPKSWALWSSSSSLWLLSKTCQVQTYKRNEQIWRLNKWLFTLTEKKKCFSLFQLFYKDWNLGILIRLMLQLAERFGLIEPSLIYMLSHSFLKIQLFPKHLKI